MWVHAALLLLPPSKAGLEPLKVPKIVSSMTKTSSGVDKSVTAIIDFEVDGRVVPAVLTCAQDRQSSFNRIVLVQGTKGYLEVAWGTYRPESLSYKAWSSEEDYGSQERPEPSAEETISFVPFPGALSPLFLFVLC